MNSIDTSSMIRVNQAGEFGAARIYAGQLAIMGDRHPMSRAIRHMASQEARHLETFNTMMAKRGVRPTALHPFWHVAGYGLGALTALMGPTAAMACTAAVETEIDRHYAEQLEQIGTSDLELSDAIIDFQAEELEHKAEAIAAGAETLPGYALMAGVIRLGCKAAIALSKRV